MIITIAICNSQYYYSYQIIKAIKTDNQKSFLKNINKIKNIDTRPYPEFIATISEYSNFSPLQEAALNGNYYYVEKLIDKEANINYQDKSMGWTPLICAIRSNGSDKEKIIIYLIEKGANVNAKDKAWRTVKDHAEMKDVIYLFE